MIQAAIFDFDGTLCDTIPLCIEAFRRAAKPWLGRDLADDEITATFGPSEEGASHLLVPGHGEEVLRDYLKYYRELHVLYRAPFDGIRELLAWLRQSGVRLGMVTGKGAGSLAISLEALGMQDVFECMECGSPLGGNKPAGIRAVLDSFQIASDRAVYVGDVVSDIHASRSVGVPVISAAWASNSQPEALRAAHPDFFAESVGALKEYLASRIS